MEDEHVQERKHKREQKHKVRKRGIEEKAAKSAKHWIRETEKKGGEERLVLALRDHHQPAPTVQEVSTCHGPAVIYQRIAGDCNSHRKQDTRPPGSTPSRGCSHRARELLLKGPAIFSARVRSQRPRIQSTGPQKAPRRVSVLNRVKKEKEAFLLSSVFATRAASSAVAFVAAGLGQSSLGRTAAAHALREERRFLYERCEMEMEMGCGMWRGERNMSTYILSPI